MILDYRRYNGFELETKEECIIWDTFDLSEFIALYNLLNGTNYDKIEILSNDYIIIYKANYAEVYRLKK